MSDFRYGLGELPVYLFNEGTNYRAYEVLGVHKYNNGWRFAVWAPAAAEVSVACDANSWTGQGMELTPAASSGIWYGWFDGIKEGDIYKYAIKARSGKTVLKADPFAFEAELRPNTASVVRDIPKYEANDGGWSEKRAKIAPYDKPMLIYEVHAASWRMHSDGTFYTYRELADELIPYACDMGYTHIELMPLTEFPFDGSWGYQVSGYFAATKRFGTPEDLMYFIAAAHKAGLYVIMDWVPAHFPRDEHGLYMFDGSAAYEYADPRMGEHKDWGTMVFDYSKGEVISFLLSSAYFWAAVYHVDGLRVDAVSSMLYRDYSRKDGEWTANIYGGNHNLEAISFLQSLNKTMFAHFPNFLMIAEESTAWGMVTGPVDKGGLGFNFKWNMGWMNDTLRYMSMDPLFRKPNHNLLTFLMYYAYSENYILPLSHDEVVHGKRSLVDKMYGSYEEKFASYRALLAYYLSLPGKKLMFMGGEIAQFIEWRYDEGLEWHLLDMEMHRKFHRYAKELNHFYIENKALWQIDNSWDGFAWINDKDDANSVLTYMRKGRKKGDEVIVCVNFTPVEREKYRIGVPRAGEYEIVMNSSEEKYGGASGNKGGALKAEKIPVLDMPYSIEADLCGLTTLYIKKKVTAKKVKSPEKGNEKVRRENK